MSEENTSQPQIVPFSRRDHARLRPGMYIGGVDEFALHLLLWDVLDDSIKEVALGYCEHIWLTLHSNDAVTVRDDGRGFPVAFAEDGKRLLEHVMTGMVRRMDDGGYQLYRSLHGAGMLSAVNALSAECTVEISRDGFLWNQSYREGLPQTEVVQVRPLNEGESTGTSITFRPDFTILEPNSFNHEMVAERMRELAYLFPGLTLILCDERTEFAKEERFYFLNGLSDYLYDLNQTHVAIHPPRYGYREWTISPNRRSDYTISVEVALQYTDTMDTKIIAYINTLRADSGLPIDILPFALLEEINRLRWVVHRWLWDEEPFTTTEILPGLTAIIVIKHPQPLYTNTRNLRILSSDAAGITAEVVSELFQGFISTDEENRIVEKFLANRRAILLNKHPTAPFPHLQDKRLRLKHRRGNRS